MKLKPLLVCILATGSFLAVSAQAAFMQTITTTGTIYEGHDCVPLQHEDGMCQGVFGVAGNDPMRSLVGKKYTMATTVSLEMPEGGWVAHGYITAEKGFGAKIVISVDGQSLTLEPSPIYMQQIRAGHAGFVGRTFTDVPEDNFGGYFEVHSGIDGTIFRYDGFNPDGNYNEAYFRGEIDSYAVKFFEVPEPVSLALFGLGMVGLGAHRRARVK